ncbi:MAG: hypothetical protein OXE04_03085, partial [bacterium]|nr:hypothetical protein [bacterium]
MSRWLRVSGLFARQSLAVLLGWVLLASVLVVAADTVVGPEPVEAQTTPMANPDGSFTVPADWALIPTGFGAGDRFRLLFSTADELEYAGVRRPFTVDDLHLFVQQQALGGKETGSVVGHSAILPYAQFFRAVVNTSHDGNVAENTGLPVSLSAARPPGTPDDKGIPFTTSAEAVGADVGPEVFWLNGAKIADDGRDLFEGTWDSNEDRNQSGTIVTSREHWTGLSTNGTVIKGDPSHNFPLVTESQTSLGIGSSSGKRLAGGIQTPNKDVDPSPLPLFGLSPVFVVAGSASGPEVSIEPTGSGTAVAEGSAVSFTVSVPSAPSADLDVDVYIGRRYTTSAAVSRRSTGIRTVTIPTNGTSITLTVATQNADSIDDPGLGVEATIVRRNHYQVSSSAGSARGPVTDDTPTTVSLSGMPTVVEGQIRRGFATVKLSRPLVADEIIDVPLVFTTSTGARLIGNDNPDFSFSVTGTGAKIQSGGNTARPTLRFSGAGAQTAQLVFQGAASDSDTNPETVDIALGTLSGSLGTNVGGGAAPDTSNNSVTLTILDAEGNSGQIIDSDAVDDSTYPYVRDPDLDGNDVRECDTTYEVKEYEGETGDTHDDDGDGVQVPVIEGPESDCFVLKLSNQPDASTETGDNDGVLIVPVVVGAEPYNEDVTKRGAVRVSSFHKIRPGNYVASKLTAGKEPNVGGLPVGDGNPEGYDRPLVFEVWPVNDGIDNPGGKRTATVTLAAKQDVANTALQDLEDVSGTDYAQMPQVVFSVIDNDPTVVTLGPADTPDHIASESDTNNKAKFKVSLGRELIPGETLYVPLMFDGGKEDADFTLTLDGSHAGVRYVKRFGYIQFDGPSQATANLVVTAIADDDGRSERVRVSIPETDGDGTNDMTATGLPGGAVGSGSVVFLITDDEKGVLIDIGASDVMELSDNVSPRRPRPSGEIKAYSVVLTAQPTADVTVTMGKALIPSPPSGTQSTNLTVANFRGGVTPLTFNSSNWNIPQSVTVRAGGNDTDNPDEVFNVTHTVTSSDTGYQNLSVPPFMVRVVDNARTKISIGQSPAHKANAQSGVVEQGSAASVFWLNTGRQLVAGEELTVPVRLRSKGFDPKYTDVFMPTLAGDGLRRGTILSSVGGSPELELIPSDASDPSRETVKLLEAFPGNLHQGYWLLKLTGPTEKRAFSVRYPRDDGDTEDDEIKLQIIGSTLNNPEAGGIQTNIQHNLSGGVHVDIPNAELDFTIKDDDKDVEVPSNWPLIPKGISTGDTFRLVFATKRSIHAQSGNIRDYDYFARGEASNGHSAISPYINNFRALISTAGVDAVPDNPTTPRWDESRPAVDAVNLKAHNDLTGTGEPIFWLSANPQSRHKIADDYAGFLSSPWSNETSPTLSSGVGTTVESDGYWTGSNSDGTAVSGNEAGSSNVAVGYLNSDTMNQDPLGGDGSQRVSTSGDEFTPRNERPLLVMSPVFTVVAAATPTIPEISITPPGSGVTEGGMATFAVTANSAPTANLTVTVSVADANNGGDFVTEDHEGTQTVTIPFGDTSKSFTLRTRADNIDEPNGQVKVTVFSGSGYTVSRSDNSASVNVADDDTTSVTLARTAGAAITEGTSIDYTVTLGRALVADEVLSVPLTFGSSDTATRGTGEDYTLTCATANGVACTNLNSGTATVTFTGGSGAADKATITLAAATDSTTESGGETVDIGLGTLVGTNLGGGATGNDSTTALTINDPAGTPEISIAPGTSPVVEGTNATFTVTASPAPTANLTVNVTVADATNGGDFVTSANTGAKTVTIPTSGSVTLTVATETDSTDEPNGTVTATVATGTGYTVNSSDGEASVKVTDDDATNVGFDNLVGKGVIVEGQTDVVEVVLSRSLVTGEILPVPVEFTVSGTATRNTDYTLACPSPLPTGVTCNNLNTATTPTVTFTGSDSAARRVRITISTTTDNNDEIGNEFGDINIGTLNASSGTNLGGGASATARGTITNSTVLLILEPAELTLSPTEVSAASLDGATITLSPKHLSFCADDAGCGDSFFNDDHTDFTAAGIGLFRLSGAPSGLSVSDVDLLGGVSGTTALGWPSEDSSHRSAQVTLAYTGAAITADDTVTITVAQPTNGEGVLAHYDDGFQTGDSRSISADFVIKPPVPVLEFASATYTAGEASGSRTATVMVNASPAPTANVTVNYAVTGTATSGTDYTALTGMATLTANATSFTIPVAVLDERDDDDSETIIITLSSGTGYTVGTQASTTITITDDDGPALAGSITTSSECDATVEVSEYARSRRVKGKVVVDPRYGPDCFELTLSEQPPASVGDAGALIVAEVTTGSGVRVSTTAFINGNAYHATNNRNGYDRPIVFQVWPVNDKTDNPGGSRTDQITLTAKQNVAGKLIKDLPDVVGYPLPTVTATIADIDPTTVTVGPADTPDNIATEDSTTDIAKFKVTLGRGLVAGETLVVPLTYTGGTEGTNFTVDLDGSPTGVAYASGELTFTGPNTGTTASSVTLVVTAASNDGNAVSERVTVTIPKASGTADGDMTATGLAGGATGTGTTRFTVVDTGKGVLLDLSGLGEVRETDGDQEVYWIDENSTPDAQTATDGTATYSIKLTAQPSADVTINLGRSTQTTSYRVIVSPETVTFDTMNWDTWQMVTFTANGDTTDRQNPSTGIKHTVTSDDSGYEGYSVPEFRVRMIDDEPSQISLRKLSDGTEQDDDDPASFVLDLGIANASGDTLSIPIRLDSAGVDPDADTGVYMPTTIGGTGGVRRSAILSSAGGKPELVLKPREGATGVEVVQVEGYAGNLHQGLWEVRITGRPSNAGPGRPGLQIELFASYPNDDGDTVDENITAMLISTGHYPLQTNRQGGAVLSSIANQISFTIEDDDSLTVPYDWPLIPSGVQEGGKFRLLFATRKPITATSGDIKDYDYFVRAEASNGAGAILPYINTFKALVSTAGAAATDAVPNNPSTPLVNEGRPAQPAVAPVNLKEHNNLSGGGEAIYWLRSFIRSYHKAADDYADFLNGGWDSESPSSATGSAITANAQGYWTGSNDDGTAEAGHQAGASQVAVGYLDSNTDQRNPLGGDGSQRAGNSTGTMTTTETVPNPDLTKKCDGNPLGDSTPSPTCQRTYLDSGRPIYGLSPVFTRGEAPVTVDLSVSRSTVIEGGGDKSVTVTATLDEAAPAEGVMIPLVVGAESSADLSDISRQSDVINIASTRTGLLSFTLIDDDVDEGEEEKLIFELGELPDGYVAGNSSSVEITITDNDTVGVMISKTTSKVTENGDTDTYTINLNSSPNSIKNEAVTVTITSDTPSAAVVDGSDEGNDGAKSETVTFGRANWQTPQTVTIIGVNDNIENPGDKRTATLTHTVTSPDSVGHQGDPKYHNLSGVDNVVVTVTDDDGEVTLSGTGVSASVEGGVLSMVERSDDLNAKESRASLTLTLDSLPSDSVGSIIIVGGVAELATVVVTEADDGPGGTGEITQRIDSMNFEIAQMASGGAVFHPESYWRGLPADSQFKQLTTAEQDNFLGACADLDETVDEDAAELQRFRNLTATVSKCAKKVTLEVAANSADIADVAGGVHSGNFTWTVYKYNTAYLNGNDATVPVPVTSLVVPNVPYRIIDDDPTSVALLPANTDTPDLTATEASNDTAAVKLQLGRILLEGETLTVPLRASGATLGTNFTLAVTGTGVTGATANGFFEVTFTGPSAHEATITVTAVDDNDAASERLTLWISEVSDVPNVPLAAGNMRSTGLAGGACSGTKCPGITPYTRAQTVQLLDNDKGVRVVLAGDQETDTDGNPLVAEASGTLTYQVSLGAAPVSGETVTVAVTSGTTAALGVTTGASLTFTSSDWSTPQRVTLTAVPNIIDAADVSVNVTHAVSSTGGTSPVYASGVSDTVLEVTVHDDDATTVTLSGGGTRATPSTGMREGDASTSDTLTVELGRALVAGETVNVLLRLDSELNGLMIPQPSGREPRVGANVSWPPQYNDFTTSVAGTGVTLGGVPTSSTDTTPTGVIETFTPSYSGYRLVQFSGAGAQTATVTFTPRSGFEDGEAADDKFGARLNIATADDEAGWFTAVNKLIGGSQTNLGGGLSRWLADVNDPAFTKWYELADSTDVPKYKQTVSAINDLPNQTTTTVPADWPLIPPGLSSGDRFRLVYVTKAETSADSTSIHYYNQFVRQEIVGNQLKEGGVPELWSIADQFNAYVSVGTRANPTAPIARGVTAYDNTSIRRSTFYGQRTALFYWVGGNKIADNFNDFTDSSWDDETNPRFADGSLATVDTGGYWTGSDGTVTYQGTYHSCTAPGRNDPYTVMGADFVSVGFLGNVGKADIDAGKGDGRRGPTGYRFSGTGTTTTSGACLGEQGRYPIVNGEPDDSGGPLPTKPLFAVSSWFLVDAVPVSAPTISIATTESITEGAQATFTLTATPAPTADLDVNVNIADATNGADYLMPQNTGLRTITIAGGATSQSFTVSTTDDSTDEPNGQITASIRSGVYHPHATDTTATVDVADDDVTGVTLARTAGAAISEAATIDYTVTLGRALVASEVLPVPLTFTGTATRGTDYTLTCAAATGVMCENLNSGGTATVTFTGGSGAVTTATITLTATRDGRTESGGETVDIGLGTLNANSGTNLGGGASGTDSAGSLTINDSTNDAGSITAGTAPDDGPGSEHDRCSDAVVELREYTGKVVNGKRDRAVPDCFELTLSAAPPSSVGDAGALIVAEVTTGSGVRVSTTAFINGNAYHATNNRNGYDRPIVFQVWPVNDKTDNPGGSRTDQITLTAKQNVAGKLIKDLPDVVGYPLPTVTATIADIDPTTVTLGPVTPADNIATEGDTSDTAKFKVTLGRGLVAGESLIIPLTYAGGTPGTNFIVALDGSPTGVAYSGNGLAFNGPSAATATLMVTAASDSNAVSERVTVTIPKAARNVPDSMLAVGLAGGATGTGTTQFTVVDTGKGVLIEGVPTGTLTIPENTAPAGQTPVPGVGTYTIRLTARPTHPVTIAMAPVSSNPGFTLTPQSMTIANDNNWANQRMITVTAVDDSSDTDRPSRQVTHTVTSSDTHYNGISVPNIRVQVIDAEVSEISLRAGAGDITNGEEQGDPAKFVVDVARWPSTGNTFKIPIRLDSAGVYPDADTGVYMPTTIGGTGGVRRSAILSSAGGQPELVLKPRKGATGVEVVQVEGFAGNLHQGLWELRITGPTRNTGSPGFASIELFASYPNDDGDTRNEEITATLIDTKYYPLQTNRHGGAIIDPDAREVSFTIADDDSLTVPNDWALIPDGLSAGEKFRLLFATRKPITATSGDIKDYDYFVRAEASNGAGAILPYINTFKALVSTAGLTATDAVPDDPSTPLVNEGRPAQPAVPAVTLLTHNELGSSDTDAKIFWLSTTPVAGDKAADDYANFLDGSWDSEPSPRNATGFATSYRRGLNDDPNLDTYDRIHPSGYWTGSQNDGTAASSASAGSSQVAVGYLNNTSTAQHTPLGGDGSVAAAASELRPIYGLSPVFTVGEPAVTVTLSATNASVTEGTGSSTFTITLSSPAPEGGVEIPIVLSDDSTADTPGDYQILNGLTRTVVADATTAFFVFSTIGDSVDEEDETAIVELGDLPAGYIAGSPSSVTVTIVDDDTAGVTVSGSTLTVSENSDTDSYTVVLDSQPASNVSVALSVTGPVLLDGPDSSSDFTASETLMFTLNSWNTPQTVRVQGQNDDFDNAGGSRTATITHDVTSSDAKYGALTGLPNVTVDVNDDDDAIDAIVLSVDADTGTNGAQSSVTENGGGKTVRVTATISGSTRFAADTDVTVTVGDSSDAAVEDTDYTAVANQTITIGAGDQSAYVDFTLTPTQDSLVEPTQSLSITGSGVGGVTFTNTSVDITDDETVPGITLAVAPTTVAEDAGSTAVTVTATVGGTTRFEAARTVVVSVAGSGTESAVDFTAVTDFNLQIAAGAASGTATFMLIPTNDSVDETDETITISGTSTALPAPTITPATLSLTDDDDGVVPVVPDVDVTLAVSNSGAVAEGGTLTVTATLGSAAPSGGVTIPVGMRTTGNPTASAADFTLSATSVTIAQGSTSGMITFTATDDDIDEDAETLVLELGTLPSGYIAGTPASVSVSISDDDTAGVIVSESTRMVGENSGTASYTVVLGSEPTADVSVALSVSGPVLLDGPDGAVTFTSSETLMFTAMNWGTAQSVRVQGQDDSVDNPGGSRSATVTHAVTSSDAKYGAVADSSVAVSVTDDDATSVGLVRVGSGDIAEDSSSSVRSAEFTVSLGRVLVAG